jgi:hypothetical protein
LKYIDGNKLGEEAATFGLEFKSKLAIPVTELALRTAIQLAKEKVKKLILFQKQMFLYLNSE